MLFDDRHGFTALQAVQSGNFAFISDAGWSLRRAGWRRRPEPTPSGGWRRRLEPAPSGGRSCALQMLIFMTAELQIRQDGGIRRPFSRHCEARSDVAIQRAWYGILDCHVATRLAMTRWGGGRKLLPRPAEFAIRPRGV
jgi:hypothetical protein